MKLIGCIWCEFIWKENLSRNQIIKTYKNRSLETSQEMAVTNEFKYGYIKPPIQLCIDFDMCCIDLLHLFLRVIFKKFKLNTVLLVI